MCALERGLSQHLLNELRGSALRRLGYEGPETVDRRILTTLDEALEVAAAVVRPNGVYRVLPVLGTSGAGIRTEAGTIRSALLTRLLKNCAGDRSIVFMVVTLGEELEKTCAPEEPLHRQLVFDMVGSELVEMMADRLETEWMAHLEGLELECSERFSPGYCDWALDGQGVIAAALDTERVGVRLNSHFVMTPRKSVSAIAVAASEVPLSAPCVFCPTEDCSFRRLPWRKIPRS